MCFLLCLKVSLVSKDSSMLDGLDNASIEMEDAKVFFSLHFVQIYKLIGKSLASSDSTLWLFHP
uniref:Uncharacterized protein n=1 Tax=Solanum tuberosum TaxID=4113 RepID=M0ZLE2_SOLTU